MKCNEIFKSALKLLNETGSDTDNEELADRSPYILAAMCSEASSLDRRYRIAHGLPEQAGFSRTYIGLDEPFPLCDRFVSTAVFYLASLLILDENEVLSDGFYEKYCDSLSSITTEIPYTVESASDVYR